MFVLFSMNIMNERFVLMRQIYEALFLALKRGEIGSSEAAGHREGRCAILEPEIGQEKSFYDGRGGNGGEHLFKCLKIETKSTYFLLLFGISPIAQVKGFQRF